VAFAQRALDAIAMGLLVLVVICVVLGLGHLKLLRISKDSKVGMKTEKILHYNFCKALNTLFHC